MAKTKHSTTRKTTKRRVRLHHMSKRELAYTIEAIYSTSKREHEIVQEAWKYLMASKSRPGTIGIVGAVLNRQIVELGYVANLSKKLAENIGLAVQS
jgi:hypothetical protein